MVFIGISRGVPRDFRGVPCGFRNFPELFSAFQGVSEAFQGVPAVVSWGFSGHRAFQGCYREFKGRSIGFQGCFRVFLMVSGEK